jgi:hypothetical protein
MAGERGSAVPEIIGEYADRIVNVEMLEHDYARRGRTHLLYEAARAKQGAPLTYLAAKGLLDNVKKGDYVILLSGAGISPWLEWGETDGPTGIASLARALSFGLGANPVYVGNEKELGPVIAAGVAAGVTVLDREAIEVYKRKNTALSVPFPLGEEGARQKALEIMDGFNPSAVIGVEKHAPNPVGVWHSAAGQAISGDTQPHVHHIVDEAKKRGVFTLGIGDGGNEIGYGLIRDEANEIYRRAYGKTCQCGCGGGEATAAATDVLISAAVSNWGAYGVSAVLAYMLGDPMVLQDADTERRMVEAMAAKGAAAAGLGASLPIVDGTSAAVQQAIVTILQEIVHNGLRSCGFDDFPTKDGVIPGRTGS